MKNIVILGQSFGVYELAKTLAPVSGVKVTVVSLDGQMSHDQNRLADYIGKTAAKDQILSADKSFYQSQNIDVILDQTLERVSLRQKKITTEDKNHIKFDVLVIAESPEYRGPDIKGVQKQGVYRASTLGEAEALIKQLSFIKSAVIEVFSWNDLKVALALKAWGKEVAVVVPNDTQMARMIEHDVCETMIKSLQEESWSVYYGQSITEVLGDAEAKAVRLSSGKVLASDVVILSMEPRLRIFEDITGADASAIMVNERFQTSVDNIVAFGAVAQGYDAVTRYWDLTDADLSRQAHALAGILGASSEQTQSSASQTVYAFDLPNWSIKVFGDVTPTANMMTFRSWNAETRVYQKIFTCDGKVKGAVTINLNNTASYEHLLAEQVPVSSCEKYVFDVVLTWDELKAILANPPQPAVDQEFESIPEEEAVVPQAQAAEQPLGN